MLASLGRLATLLVRVAITREHHEVVRLEALVERLKRRERALRLSEAHLRQVVDGLKDHALIMLDTEGRVVSWNRGAEGLKGYREEEMLGRSVAPIHEGEFSDPDNVRKGLAKAAADGHLEVESWCVRKDGSRFLSEDTVFPLWTEDGKLRGFSVVSRDVTRRRRAEEERDRLYHEAQESIRMRDEFLSVASHELKTPITALQLNLRTLRLLAGRGPDAFSPERVLKKLSLAEEQVKRLARLVHDLLDLSRLNSGRMEFRFETIDVARLLRELVERQRSALRHSGSEVRLRLQEVCLARVDPMRLEQILTNLLSNAAKYGQRQPIDLSLEGDETGYCIQVRDRGIGIAPEDQQRIFERFERAVSERHYGGLGLGLWITRRIVKELGGSIEVRSQPGEGSSFVLCLPRFPLEAHRSDSPDAGAMDQLR
jgi:PAS domain S-box-containing protein